MPRDVVHLTTRTVRTRTYHSSPKRCDELPNWELVHNYHIARKSERGIVRSSDHITPTYYYARFYTASPAQLNTKSRQVLHRDCIAATGKRGYLYQWHEDTGQKPLNPSGTGWELTDLTKNWSAALSNRSYIRLMEKVRDSDFDLGETLGEIPGSYRTVSSLFLTGARAIAHLKRGRFAKAAKLLGINPKEGPKAHLDRATNMYLTIKFGISPLMDGIYNGVEHVKNAYSSPHGLVRSTYVAKEDYSPSYTWFKTKGSIVRGSKHGVVYRVSDSAKHARAKLNILNPIPIAWELLPLSFVIDWFINVGPTLKALTTPAGLTYISGYETRFTSGSFSLLEDDCPTCVSGGLVEFPITVNGMVRLPLTTWKMPSPYLNLGLSPGKVVTALALLNNRASL